MSRAFSDIIQQTYVIKNEEVISPTTSVFANSKKQAMSCDGGYQLLEEESQQNEADDCQAQIMRFEKTIKLIRGPIAHEFAPPKYNNVV